MPQADIKLRPEWKELLIEEFGKPYFAELREKVRDAYLAGPVHPKPADLFRAFDLVPPKDVKVVILGQDPYHTPGVAHGLAFSTGSHNPVPPSLSNIFKELQAEYGTPVNRDPDLTRWARQGVLLLNASLSVASGQANSHETFGWHQFTDAAIKALADKEKDIVFMLWGSFAQKKEALIDWTRHLVLKSAHPSPLSAHRGFLGNGHFEEANDYLKAHGRGEIDWLA
jgi:uracil-DNA glycosylase